MPTGTLLLRPYYPISAWHATDKNGNQIGVAYKSDPALVKKLGDIPDTSKFTAAVQDARATAWADHEKATAKDMGLSEDEYRRHPDAHNDDFRAHVDSQ